MDDIPPHIRLPSDFPSQLPPLFAPPRLTMNNLPRVR